MPILAPLPLLVERFETALRALGGATAAATQAHVRAAGDSKFGDYQCNAAMALAKQFALKPRELAEKLVATAKLDDIAEKIEIAGPGFINITLKIAYIESVLAQGLRGYVTPTDAGATAQAKTGGSTSENASRFAPMDRIGIPTAANPDTVVLDYSSPNIAKQMHVGHLRTTVIGDVFARVLEFAGHRVIRQNHIGDWGTAIGAVITGLWYIRTRIARGETLDAIRARLTQALELKGKPVEARRAWLEPIAAEWTADLAREGESSTKSRATTLDELELGYVFVQTLSSVAEGSDVRVGGGDGAKRLEDIPRLTTTFLQRGDAWERGEWEQARAISMNACQELYERLGVTLRAEDVFGESAYEPMLPKTVSDIRSLLATRRASADGAIAAECRENQGAQCIFLYSAKGEPAYKTAEGEPLPMIIQKSDGAYLYASTDLAAVRHRTETLGATRVIYVVGAPQKLHFEMLFAAARALGWDHGARLEHVAFGSVLGENRKPLKTRDGGNVKLRDLLDEAEKRAYELLLERERGEAANSELRIANSELGSAGGTAASESGGAPSRRLSDAQMREIARRVGIGAIKYFDLARDRNGDYVFHWDQMLAFQGNTAPYLMYAYARIRSIHRKAAETGGAAGGGTAPAAVRLEHATERALGLRLARFRETLDAIVADLMPHVLCAYLYDLASDFMRFYESCPVLVDDLAVRGARLNLCDLTARTLKLGLSLVGIEAIEQM
ncbi:MAG: arginine--tRNA ligase [Phycisphaerae bacterium]|nr:arginine--tRNA ligase [Phycisphaerae bacterium]